MANIHKSRGLPLNPYSTAWALRFGLLGSPWGICLKPNWYSTLPPNLNLALKRASINNESKSCWAAPCNISTHPSYKHNDDSEDPLRRLPLSSHYLPHIRQCWRTVFSRSSKYPRWMFEWSTGCEYFAVSCLPWLWLQLMALMEINLEGVANLIA